MFSVVLSSSEGSGGQASQFVAAQSSQPVAYTQALQNSYAHNLYPQSVPADFKAGEFKVPDQRLIIDTDAVEELPAVIASRTEEFTVEQLEQVNAALMDTIWTHRALSNKQVVLGEVRKTMDEVLNDIREMQEAVAASDRDDE